MYYTNKDTTGVMHVAGQRKEFAIPAGTSIEYFDCRYRLSDAGINQIFKPNDYDRFDAVHRGVFVPSDAVEYVKTSNLD